MIAHEITKAPIKGILFFNKSGRKKKNEREGKTIQKIQVESLETLVMFPVSRKSQIIAIREIRGSEVMIPPTKEYLFETSDIITIKRAEMVNLRI